MKNTPKKTDMAANTLLGELNIEEIANISNTPLSDTQFIATDNLENYIYLGRDYLDSIGNFRTGAPFKIRFTMLMFCLSGGMEVQLNLTRHTLKPGEMLAVNEGTVATSNWLDPESRLFIMGFSRKFIESRAPSLLGGMVFSRLIRNPVIRLDEADMSDILAIYRIIRRRLAEAEFNRKDQLAWEGLHTILSILANRLESDPTDTAGNTRRQVVVRDFMMLVGKWASSRRDIASYARKLNVSAKYLSQIVAEVTGETPRKWICRQVVLEAKALLDDPTLSVQQISESLNFANQSFFGTFFRRHTGLSPKAYRNRPAK